MLVDLTVDNDFEKHVIKIVDNTEESRFYSDPENLHLILPSHPKNHIEKGIYNFDSGSTLFLQSFNETKDLEFKNEYWNVDINGNFINSYGVADNLEQIKNYYKNQIEDEVDKYVIIISYIYQEPKNKGKGGGWRWHKWGPYIGNLNPQCEYLDDEDFGEDFKGYVIIFHCYKV